MPRIRTIKPEFFKHEDLFDLEAETGLPVRLSFAGLWGHCDREGWFRWKPRALKSDILPYDDLDFGAVLDALASAGIIEKHTVDGKEYGYVPSFLEHQRPNNKEADSLVQARLSELKADQGTLEKDISQKKQDKAEGEQEQEGERNIVRPRKRAQAIPDGFPDDLSYATENGLSLPQAKAEAEKFRNHHEAKGTVFKDWGAAWRNWVIRSKEFGFPGAGPPRANGGHVPFDPEAARRRRQPSVAEIEAGKRAAAAREREQAEMRKRKAEKETGATP